MTPTKDLRETWVCPLCGLSLGKVKGYGHQEMADRAITHLFIECEK